MVADVALSAEFVNLPGGVLSLPNREFQRQEFEYQIPRPTVTTSYRNNIPA